MKKPNVLIVLTDQWRYQSGGWAGEPVQTPNLDRFANEGVHCQRAVSGTPVCTPARASLLTGLKPDKHGLFLNDVALNAELPSMGKHFKAAGYDTAYVGKWHVNGNGRYNYIPPERRHGFDYWKVLECTHDYNKSRYYDNNDDELKYWEGYDAIAQTHDIISWIRDGRDKSAPFMAVLAWGPPHGPYDTAPEEYRSRYNPDDMPVPASVPEQERDDVRRNTAGYYAHCTAMDDMFGEILKTLEEQGLEKDTLVVFTSDHGDFLGAHGLWDKQGPWDESIRIPMFLQGPGLPSGSINNSLIDLMDLWPTLADLCGLDIPEKLQARNFAEHLKKGTCPPDNSALLASYHTFGNWPNIAREKSEPLYYARVYRGIRTAEHTYVEDQNGPWLLYDNTNDPLQMNNLIDDPSSQELQGRMAAVLRAKLEEYDDEFSDEGELAARWNYPVGPRGTIGCPGWEG